MAGETPEFPDGDAWTDHMPDVRAGFSANSPRKAAAPEATKPAPASSANANDEYKVFASLDLTNIGS